MHVVIRAGGTGTRLWPLSRRNNPKQLLPLLSEHSLLEETLRRVRAFVPDENLAITTHVAFAGRVAKLAGKDIRVIAEPLTKNTGPAICLEMLSLIPVWGEEAIVASIPSDDYIQNPEAFTALLRSAETFVQKNPQAIVTPAVQPTSVDVGASYLKSGKAAEGDSEEIFAVEDWVEKPSEDFCRSLISSGRYFTHTGMYVWRLGTIRDLFWRLQPELVKVCEEVMAAMKAGDLKAAANRYESVSSVSVETAITRNAPNLFMTTSNRLGWSDVGKWSLVRKLLAESHDTVVTRGNVIPKDTTESLVMAPDGKVIAVIGLNNICVIDSGDALLVAPLDRVAEVKDIVAELQRRGFDKYL